MAAAFYKADNLIGFVDNNNLQLDGHLDEVMSPYPIGEKFRAFGWNALEIEGHDVAQISSAVEFAKNTKDKPTIIICNTVKGKGVSIFENQVRFHGGQPTPQEWDIAFRELDEKIRELEG